MSSDRLLYVVPSGHVFVPTRGYPGDAGLDLYCAENRTIDPGKWVDVDLGIQIALPHGTWALLTGRSSTLRRRGLLVNQGIIDNGYRGPLFANMVNMTDEPVEIRVGERLVQLVILPVWAGQAVACTELPWASRGDAGFGSTGT